jgi:putative oxidoreductase
MRRCLYSDSLGYRDSLGLLIVRVVVGVAFMYHGWPKINAPMEWMGPDATVPAPLQAAAAAAEFVGGAALVLGLLARVAALALAATMTVAAITVHIPQGHAFVGKPGDPSWELAGVYLACSLLFLLSGAGRFSLDAALFSPREETTAP